MRGRVRMAGVALLAAVASACATGGARPGSGGSTDPVTRLEAERTAKPNNAGVLRALGIVYYKAGRFADAYRVLEQARALNPKDGTTALYAGLSAEQLGNFSAARTAYTSYLEHGKTRRVRGQLQARLAALARRELVEQAKAAIANEQTMASVVGNDRTIAVLPFRFTGTDSSLIPLERGMAELVVTDLAKVKSLTVVERERMQALVDEMALSRSGSVDAATAVRAGRLIRAGRLVQGSLTELPQSSLRVDAAMVDVPTSRAAGSAATNDKLDELFAMEKRIVLDLIEDVGIQLTAQERRSIDERPTRSLAAFLAFSSGLMAQDNGNLDQAQRFFNDAVRVDPSFAPAAQKQAEVQQIQAGEQVTAAAVEASVAAAPEGEVVADAIVGESQPTTEDNSLGSTAAATAESLNPSAASTAINSGSTGSGTNDPSQTSNSTSQSTGNNNITNQSGTISVIVVQPGTPRQ